VKFFGWEPFAKKTAAVALPADSRELYPNINAYDGGGYGQGLAPAVNTIFDGDKFPGGFGPTQLFTADYWTLRKRSEQLFSQNLYARGLIRRLITNEINTGLTPEAYPDEELIGVPEDSLDDWTETTENRFAIWAKNPKLCDWKQKDTYGAIQRAIRMAALISGDVLVVMRRSQVTKLPMIQLISGSKVQSPLQDPRGLRKGHKITHGVEHDTLGRVAAHWVKQDDGTIKRLPAFGEKSGRKLSWLVYGTEKLLDAVRGEPLLAIVLQSLKEIDRYRDSAQRKAVVNSIVAMFIKKGDDKMSTLPISGGAVRKDQVTVQDDGNSARTVNLASQLPGVVMEELQTGEEPVLLGGQGTDVNFGPFEEALIQGVAWANEIPPEILRLAFSNNYSASQAAINEFKIYLNMRWAIEGETVGTHVYTDWLISETLTGKTVAPGLLDAWRDPQQYDVFGAWTCVEWNGQIKVSTDMLKQVKASDLLVAGGYSTRSREARITTGTKFSKNAKRLKRENALLVEAATPMAEFKAKFNEQVAGESLTAVAEAISELAEAQTHEQN
jgi:capsid protein